MRLVIAAVVVLSCVACDAFRGGAGQPCNYDASCDHEQLQCVDVGPYPGHYKCLAPKLTDLAPFKR